MHRAHSSGDNEAILRQRQAGAGRIIHPMFANKARRDDYTSSTLAFGLLFAVIFHWSIFPLALMTIGVLELRHKRNLIIAVSYLAIGASMLAVNAGYQLGKLLAERDNALQVSAIQQAR